MSPETPADRQFMDRAIETFIRIVLIAILAAWCFDIVRPFIVPSVWGLIIAIGLHPIHGRLHAVLGDRPALAAILLSLVAFATLIVPAVLLSGSVVDGIHILMVDYREGELQVPLPPDWVAGLPLVGGAVDSFWREASHNLADVLQRALPEIKMALRWLGGMAAGAGMGILQFIFAIAIAGVLLAHEGAAKRSTQTIARRLAGARGVEFAELATATVRSVTRGILGVALIQAVLAGLGWLAVGVPLAGLWALLALLLSVVQIGILPVALPILIYVFFHSSTLTFVVFLIWTLFVGTIDNILKPILLGRGVEVPMAVIFVGAIGGFLSSGIIGLFVGSVVLVLGYKLFVVWLAERPEPPAAPAEPAP
ncbi:AI-2E family transporter [uncultured Thiodictyon sp.]|uniref:AI-2E family transporter n=1 Tax=uncultured Thiodictyon sp. TaxID=1846217 RepID=UPI0025D990F5|nr:AI-2E family transporter [uncultured Thiodictyon sp.]